MSLQRYSRSGSSIGKLLCSLRKERWNSSCYFYLTSCGLFSQQGTSSRNHQLRSHSRGCTGLLKSTCRVQWWLRSVRKTYPGLSSASSWIQSPLTWNPSSWGHLCRHPCWEQSICCRLSLVFLGNRGAQVISLSVPLPFQCSGMPVWRCRWISSCRLCCTFSDRRSYQSGRVGVWDRIYAR